jgi:uncharacterized alpha/beta hydrolase family protein
MKALYIIIILGVSLILLFVMMQIDFQQTKIKEPVSTNQYSKPIGPTREPPYQLESKSLLEVKK